MQEDVPLSSPCDIFDADYYMSGPQTGKSNYENYQWLPDMTIPMAAKIKKYLGIKPGETLYDYGCARGFVVRAFRIIGVEAFGYDISKWAIENCDPEVQAFVSNDPSIGLMSYDYVLCKDVMEHIPEEELKELVPRLIRSCKRSMLIIVPLAHQEGGSYVCPKDEKDITHKIRWPITKWLKFLENIDRRLVVTSGYYIPEIKQENTAWEDSCGFFLIRRI
jgi:hypothetical protein